MTKKQKNIKLPTPIMDISTTDLARIKATVYRGKADMCWFTTRDEIKGLIKIVEAYFSATDDKKD